MSLINLDHLSPIQKTSLITLKGRALDRDARVSFLHDDTAAGLVQRLDYDMETVKLGAGVREGIGVRSSMLDRAVTAFIRAHPDAVVVELGAGFETRAFRIAPPSTVDWYDVDFPEVIELRRRIMPERGTVHSIAASLLAPDWVLSIPADRPAILVADGLIGFLTEEDVTRILHGITAHFTTGELVTNAYSTATARFTRYFTKSVGMPKGFKGYGFNDPHHLSTLNASLRLIEELTTAAAPESRRLTGAAGFNARMLARRPTLARRSGWILRYRF